MTTRILWFVLGVVAGLAFAHRKTIADLYYNRGKLSTGSKVVGGLKDVFEGGKEIWEGF